MGASFSIIDPHFHCYDTAKHPNPSLAGELAEKLPTYSMLDYDRDCGVGVKGSVHIETITGDAEGGPKVDPVGETKFVLEQLGAEGAKCVTLVAFAHLARVPEAEATIIAHQHLAGARLVGIRMILNHSSEDPSLTWPQVERGDYLTGGVPEFKEGFALLQEYSLSFDLHVNWFQLSDAAMFLKDFPETVVILDHLGCLKLGVSAEEDEKRIAVWRDGMKALAGLPNTYVKASMLEYIRKGWQEGGDSEAHAVVKKLVLETIELFGADRVMFASNFPVDKVTANTSLEDLITAQHGLVADLPDEQRRALFHDNAAKVYKLVV